MFPSAAVENALESRLAGAIPGKQSPSSHEFELDEGLDIGAAWFRPRDFDPPAGMLRADDTEAAPVSWCAGNAASARRVKRTIEEWVDGAPRTRPRPGSFARSLDGQ
jgi:hypothetical protein